MLGLFCLCHYIYRSALALTGIDPSGGLGAGRLRRRGLVMIGAHAALSMSSLRFVVPQERVATRPMIWQEFRAHNIVFALRSASCCALTALACAGTLSRSTAVLGCALAVPVSMAAADVATARLRSDARESTTATMPYWPSASARTQRRFKTFYAYCQYMATLGCLACANPVWPLLIMLPIQLASLLMTLVRKGLLSCRGYHLIYTGTLCFPFVLGVASSIQRRMFDFVLLTPLAAAMLAARAAGAGKYALWAPVIGARVVLGDRLITLGW